MYLNYHYILLDIPTEPYKCVFLPDPILPDLLHQIDLHPHRFISSSFFTHPDLINSKNASAGLESKNSVKIAVLVGMKPLLEVIFNVIVGFILERYGLCYR